jgi:hypothetical protein
VLKWIRWNNFILFPLLGGLGGNKKIYGSWEERKFRLSARGAPKSVEKKIC